MKDFKKEYEATVQQVTETDEGARLVIDIKKVKSESLELERRGKLGFFRQLLKDKKGVVASDFAEEGIQKFFRYGVVCLGAVQLDVVRWSKLRNVWPFIVKKMAQFLCTVY